MRHWQPAGERMFRLCSAKRKQIADDGASPRISRQWKGIPYVPCMMRGTPTNPSGLSPPNASANDCELLYPANVSGLMAGWGPLKLAGCTNHTRYWISDAAEKLGRWKLQTPRTRYSKS